MQRSDRIFIKHWEATSDLQSAYPKYNVKLSRGFFDCHICSSEGFTFVLLIRPQTYWYLVFSASLRGHFSRLGQTRSSSWWEIRWTLTQTCCVSRRGTWWPSSTSTRRGSSWPGRFYWNSNMWVLLQTFPHKQEGYNLHNIKRTRQCCVYGFDVYVCWSFSHKSKLAIVDGWTVVSAINDLLYISSNLLYNLKWGDFNPFAVGGQKRNWRSNFNADINKQVWY